MDKEEADLEKLIFGCNPEDLEDVDDFEENSTEDNFLTKPEEKAVINVMLLKLF